VHLKFIELIVRMRFIRRRLLAEWGGKMVFRGNGAISEVYEWVDSALNDYGGIIVVTVDNRIRYVSPRLLKSLSRSAGVEAVQKSLEEYIFEYDVRQVLETGMPQKGKPRKVGGREIISFILPVFQNERLVGAILFVLLSLSETIPFSAQETKFQDIKKQLGAKYSFDSIIGNSLAIVKAKRMAWDIAATNSAAFISGETGTGKELFAHAIHQDSPRRDNPFVVINCAGIPYSLVESELFGYEAGAFTGANTNGKSGKFELADGGTIFLDEVSELPFNVQAKLLRVLEDHEIERVGGTTTKKINVRIISACNVDIETHVKQDKFREDLYYRLNVFSIRVPPLRERLEDITSLSFSFITQFNQESGTNVTGLSAASLSKLMGYKWPGNVRELKNTIQRACLHAKVGMIEPEDLHFTNNEHLPKNLEVKAVKKQPSLREARSEAEREIIIQALEDAGGNKTKASQLLGLSRTSFYKKLKELGLS
jgi:transcriptional regulator with PAS, ATPase and Fis domain